MAEHGGQRPQNRMRWVRERQWVLLLAGFVAVSGTYVACASSGDEAEDQVTDDAGFGSGGNAGNSGNHTDAATSTSGPGTTTHK